MEFSGELFFPGGVSASFYCSFRTENQQWATVSGTKGSLSRAGFRPPVLRREAAFEVNQPFFRVSGCDFNMESHPRRLAVHEYSNGTPDAQETNMIRTFAGVVISGKLDPTWGEIALGSQRILDACLASARDGGKLVPLS